MLLFNGHMAPFSRRHSIVICPPSLGVIWLRRNSVVVGLPYNRKKPLPPFLVVGGLAALTKFLPLVLFVLH